MPVVTISSSGSIVIPLDLRQKYGLGAGAQVAIVDYGGVLTLAPAFDDPVAQAQGMLAGGPSLTDALLLERAQEMTS